MIGFAPDPMNQLSISLFGSFRVSLNGSPTAFEADSAVLTGLSRGQCRERSDRAAKLAALLWPEQTERTAFQNLRKALNRLRRAIGDGASSSRLLSVTVPRCALTPATAARSTSRRLRSCWPLAAPTGTAG